MAFTPLKDLGSGTGGFTPLNQLSPNQASATLGHSTGLLGTVLSTGGAVLGGIGGAAGGAALGAAAGVETGPGALGTGAIGGYLGGVAGAGAGAAGGEALAQKIEGQKLDIGSAAKTGLGFGVLEAIGGPLASLAGKGLKAVGETAAKMFLPTSAKEAVQVQAYKAANPLIDRVWQGLAGTASKAPTTAAGTAFKKGLMGTETMLGIQAKRAATKLWDNTISPALKESGATQDMSSFFKEAEESIVKNTKELGDRSARVDALNAIREDYKTAPTATMEDLQGYKEGWASHVPEKYYKGKDITQTYNNVRAELADLARGKIYSALGPEVRQAYFDYGNLKGVQQLGQTAMTGQKLKGGTFSGLHQIYEMLTVPMGTIGGQTLYKVGQGVEMLGKPGARTVRDLIYGYANQGETPSSPTQ